MLNVISNSQRQSVFVGTKLLQLKFIIYQIKSLKVKFIIYMLKIYTKQTILEISRQSP
jgi:hypothetical protein